MNTINLTPIVNAIIALASALITVFVIPWLRSKYGNEELSKFLTLVQIGVTAAEQIYDANDGEAKKEYVVKYLADRGYSIDDSVNNAIEAAVLELHSNLL